MSSFRSMTCCASGCQCHGITSRTLSCHSETPCASSIFHLAYLDLQRGSLVSLNNHLLLLMSPLFSFTNVLSCAPPGLAALKMCNLPMTKHSFTSSPIRQHRQCWHHLAISRWNWIPRLCVPILHFNICSFFHQMLTNPCPSTFTKLEADMEKFSQTVLPLRWSFLSEHAANTSFLYAIKFLKK